MNSFFVKSNGHTNTPEKKNKRLEWHEKRTHNAEKNISNESRSIYPSVDLVNGTGGLSMHARTQARSCLIQFIACHVIERRQQKKRTTKILYHRQRTLFVVQKNAKTLGKEGGENEQTTATRWRISVCGELWYTTKIMRPSSTHGRHNNNNNTITNSIDHFDGLIEFGDFDWFIYQIGWIASSTQAHRAHTF